MDQLLSTDPRLEPERLKFITEPLSGSQYLVLAAMGVWLFLNKAEQVSFFPWWGSFLVWAASVLLLVLVFRYLPKYHERRFGRVEPKSRMSPVGAMICGALLVGIPIFLIGWQIVAILWGEQLTSLISEFESWFVQTIPFPRNTYLLALWVFGFFDSFRELRFDPFRPYFYLLGTFATCVVVFCPYWYPAARGVAAWKILNAGWLGLSCVALGLYQHLLLVRLMPQHGRDNDDES